MHKDNKNHNIKTFLSFFLHKKSKKTESRPENSTKIRYLKARNSLLKHLKGIIKDDYNEN
jgi:hypothetical protein